VFYGWCQLDPGVQTKASIDCWVMQKKKAGDLMLFILNHILHDFARTFFAKLKNLYNKKATGDGGLIACCVGRCADSTQFQRTRHEKSGNFV